VTAKPEKSSRRSFLKTGAAIVLLPSTVLTQIIIERGRFGEDDIPLAHTRLLDQLNAERVGAGLSLLKLDEHACEVAAQHARDMVTGQFLSHWGSDGRKPYHRYSFAGGVDALQENVSSAEGVASLTPAGIQRDLFDMHASMFAELPPNDGHRKTIVYPHHTHVGFGIAIRDRSLRLDELYLSRYVEIESLPRQAKPKARIMVSGRVLNPKLLINGAEVFFEPLPSPPEIAWLRIPRSYGMPADVAGRILPRLPDRYFYSDGSSGALEITTGNRFRMPVILSKKPGINTIMLWLKAGQNGTPFPGTQICIRVE
jgi:hypothetical protein